jgi:hypothetical protein
VRWIATCSNPNLHDVDAEPRGLHVLADRFFSKQPEKVSSLEKHTTWKKKNHIK